MSQLSVSRFFMTGMALAVVSGLLVVPASLLQAQQPSASVFVAAVDSSGAPITDIEPSQVKLSLDGVQCASTKLEPINWPTKVQVLIDNSGVVRDSIANLRDGVRAFLGELPEGLEVSMYVLSPQPRPLLRPTTDRQAMLKSVDTLGPDAGGAKFLEGFLEAVGRVQRDRGNFFHAIMAFTSDGIESSNGDLEGNFDRLQKQVQERPLTVHALMLSLYATLGSRSSGLQLNISRSLTQGTGGRFENVAGASQLAAKSPEFARLIARSHQLQSHQYRVSCEGSTAKAPRVSVATTHPRIANVFVTRNGQITGS
jgi:hypothetical protein